MAHGGCPVSDCEKCRTLTEVMAATSDKSLIIDCAVLIRRHPNHTPYPESVVSVLRAPESAGADERLRSKVADVNRRSREGL